MYTQTMNDCKGIYIYIYRERYTDISSSLSLSPHPGWPAVGAALVNK